MKNKSLFYQIITYAFIIIVMAVYLVPLFNVLNVSLKTEPEYLKNSVALTKSFHIQNFVDAWNQARLGSYILNSIFYLVVCTSLSMILAVLLAFPIARNYLKFGSLLFSLFLAGLFLPDGSIPQFQLFLKLHLYNTRIGYMLGMIGGGGIPLFFFVSYIKGIPRDFDEAASIDGCGYFRYVFTILMPLMKPAIASMAILSAIGVWNEALRAIIYLSNESLYPITRGLFTFVGNYSIQWTLQASALVIVAAPIIVLYIFLQNYIIDGTLSGAIKS